jgi:nitrous oxide reductase
MSNNNQPKELNRRTFLRTVALGGGAVGVLAGTGISFSAMAEERAPASRKETQREDSRGYHVTEHIREYYRKATF